MSTLAIKGHPTRGSEVIALLEMLGGNNPHNYSADCDSLCFYVDKGTNIIYYDWVNNCYEDEDILVFTLEEFKKKFPYKVGDKVSSKYLKNYEISKMEWESINNRVIYKLRGMGWYSADELQPYKEETIKEKDEKSAKHVFDTEIISFDIAQRDKYELDLQGKFKVVLREGKYYVERIKPQYPRDFDECCEVLNTHLSNVTRPIGWKENLISKFQELIICRDAYWKIAGDEYQLGKPWEPDWKDNYQRKWSINFYQGEINFTNTTNVHNVLVFPTKEMRDTFYKNFKDLIEYCKELL